MSEEAAAKVMVLTDHKFLHDPEEAGLSCLNAALEDEDFGVFLPALRDVAESRGV